MTEVTHFERNIPQDVDFRTELAERFQEANPTIKVKIEVMPEDYQPELFAEAEVDEPTDEWTDDDVIDAAQRLTKRDGEQVDVYGLWVAPYFEASLTPISAHGGWPISADGTTALYDDKNTIAGGRWIRDAMNEHKVALQNPSFSNLWYSCLAEYYRYNGMFTE